jgi:putative ABC transport system substrate-binding protein
LVNQGIDIIVTEGGIGVRAAAAASSTVPIVTASAADPFLGGLVKNLSRPGGNITGFVSLERDISGKVFGILKEMVPPLVRIAVLATRPIWALFAPGQDQAAKVLGIEYGFIDMPQPEAVGSAMRQALAEGAQGAVRFNFAGCCARAARGQATAAPSPAMKARRLIRSPRRRGPIALAAP